MYFSIANIVGDDGTDYGIGVVLDSTLLDNLTPDERKEMVKERVKELGGSVITAYDNNGNEVKITIAKPGSSFKNQNGKRRKVNDDLTKKYIGNEVKQEAVVLVDELITTSKLQTDNPAKHPHDWLDDNGKNNWDVWTTYIQDKNNTIWKAKLHIANTAYGEKIIYDVDPNEKVGQAGNSATSLHDDIVTQPNNGVNNEFTDIDGEPIDTDRITENEFDGRRSLSFADNQIAPIGNYNVSGKDIALDGDIAPVRNKIKKENFCPLHGVKYTHHRV